MKKKKKYNDYTADIKNVLKVWRMRDLTIEGKIIIFKSLAISKIVHLALIKTVPIFTVEQLKIVKKKLYLEAKNTNNKTLYPM